MQNTFDSQEMILYVFFSQKIIFSKYVSGTRPPPFMANAILNFHVLDPSPSENKQFKNTWEAKRIEKKVVIEMRYMSAEALFKSYLHITFKFLFQVC